MTEQLQKTARELLEEAVAMFSFPLMEDEAGEVRWTGWTGGHEFDLDDRSTETNPEIRSWRVTPLARDLVSVDVHSDIAGHEYTHFVASTVCSVGAISLANLTNGLCNRDKVTYTSFTTQAATNYQVALAAYAVCLEILRDDKNRAGVFVGETRAEFDEMHHWLESRPLAWALEHENLWMKPDSLDTIESVIISWNDDHCNDWHDPVDLFNRAIKNLIEVERA